MAPKTLAFSAEFRRGENSPLPAVHIFLPRTIIMHSLIRVHENRNQEKGSDFKLTFFGREKNRIKVLIGERILLIGGLFLAHYQLFSVSSVWCVRVCVSRHLKP